MVFGYRNKSKPRKNTLRSYRNYRSNYRPLMNIDKNSKERYATLLEAVLGFTANVILQFYFIYNCKLQVNYLQNENNLLENKQKELKETIQNLIQSKECFMNAHEVCENEARLMVKRNFLFMYCNLRVMQGQICNI